MLHLHILRPVYFASFPLCGRDLSKKGLPVWADQHGSSSLTFSESEFHSLFFLVFWRVAEKSKLSSQGGSSEIWQRGITPTLRGEFNCPSTSETFLHPVSHEGRLNLLPVVYFRSSKQPLSHFLLSQFNKRTVSPLASLLTAWAVVPHNHKVSF